MLYSLHFRQATLWRLRNSWSESMSCLHGSLTLPACIWQCSAHRLRMRGYEDWKILIFAARSSLTAVRSAKDISGVAAAGPLLVTCGYKTVVAGREPCPHPVAASSGSSMMGCTIL